MCSRDGVGNVTGSGSGQNPSMRSRDGELVRGAIDQGQDSSEECMGDYTRSVSGLGSMGPELVLEDRS